jgi:hypothetical protein
MTGFENYIQANGGKLISGKDGDFNTYNNTQRTWIIGETQAIIQIGLFSYDNKTIFGVLRPVLDFLPNEEDFEDMVFFLSGFSMSTNLNSDKVELFKRQEF